MKGALLLLQVICRMLLAGVGRDWLPLVFQHTYAAHVIRADIANSWHSAGSPLGLYGGFP